MKILLDANLSYRLVKKLQPYFSDVIHVSQTGLQHPAKDTAIWSWATQNNAAIISNDADFQLLSERLGSPPKVIHLSMGNMPTNALFELLIRHQQDIQSFLKDDTNNILIFY